MGELCIVLGADWEDSIAVYLVGCMVEAEVVASIGAGRLVEVLDGSS